MGLNFPHEVENQHQLPANKELIMIQLTHKSMQYKTHRIDRTEHTKDFENAKQCN